VTRTAVTFKTSPGHTLVWATDLRSGRPLPGLLVRVVRQDTGGLVAAGHTGDDGVLAVPDSTTQTYGLVALLDRLGDAALCGSNWNSGGAAYDFTLPGPYGLAPHKGDRYPDPYTDRPIYRPGQPVRFRGRLRRDDDGAYSLLARNTPVRVTMTDSSGHLLYNRLVHPDAFGAFAGIIGLSQPGRGTVMIDELSGLWRRRPWVALGRGVMMLALLGFPFFGGAGFFAKWYVLQVALHAPVRQTTLAVVLVLTTVVSAGYYLYVVMMMFMRQPSEGAGGSEPPASGGITGAVLLVTTVLILLIGLAPDSLVRLTRASRVEVATPSRGGMPSAIPILRPAQPTLSR